MISVGLLGSLTFRINDGPVVNGELGHQGRLLAGYLFSSPGKVYRRERLADQFWGELDEDRSRGALNTALWRIRKVLAQDQQSSHESCLHTSALDIVVEPVEWLHIDVIEFENDARRALESPGDEESRTLLLERAVSSYTAPFFEGEDCDWVIERRERVHSKYVRLAIELVQRLHSAGRIEEGIELARKILAEDPFRETVHRELLILLFRAGERVQALHIHKRWVALLRNELDIEPMPETEELVRSIRLGRLAPTPELRA